MYKYCLSYDVINSDKNDPETIKRKITTLILKQGITHTLKNPVASTIIFEDDNDERNISYWNSLLLKMKNIHYYICLVPLDYELNQFIERNEGNSILNNNFQHLVREIIQEGLNSPL
jgi:hypothetical protein